MVVGVIDDKERREQALTFGDVIRVRTRTRQCFRSK
jgi:hypothetical protein